MRREFNTRFHAAGVLRLPRADAISYLPKLISIRGVIAQ